jgi:8-oxo-dGTP pyrophosphatase MutT (NUDIX family)
MRVERAGIIITDPYITHILLIQDSRHGKWSIPKGSVEDYDRSYLATAIREVQEETEFREGIDYWIQDHKPYIIRKCLFYFGMSTHLGLYRMSKLEEHVQVIAWVPVTEVKDLYTNAYTRIAFELLGWR